MGTVAGTPLKAEMGKLKQNVCFTENVCLLLRATREDCFTKNDWIAPARVGYESIFVPGGAGIPLEVCKIGEAPARGAARSAAGGRRRRPKAGDAFRGGGDTTRPLDAKPARGNANFPRKISRGTRPARPAGGGTNAFCFPSMGEPAPLRHNEHPARNTEFCGSSRRLFRDYLPRRKDSPAFRPARVLSNRFS